MDLYNFLKRKYRLFGAVILCSNFIFGTNRAFAETLILPIELYIGIVNASANITFTMTAESVVWAANRWFEDDFLISDEYNTSQWTADYTLTSVDSWEGWHFVTSQGSLFPVYAYGLYKFSMDQYNYFYLDYRDDRYGNYSGFGEPFGHEIDLWIKYDANSYTFYYSTDKIYWVEIDNGELYAIWEIKQMGDPTKDKFQPTTPTNLSVTWSGGHPLLSWNCSEPQQSATYEVWRKVMGGFKYKQTIVDWLKIGTNSVEDTTYTDTDFGSGSGYKAYYKVRAVSGDGNLYSPDWKNTVSVIGNFAPTSKGKKIDVRTFEPIEKSISVSPNPFNNTVHISLESGDSPVSDISIYDLTGRVVYSKQLNGHIGYYDFIWNARDPNGLRMRSGMYFLIVRSGRKTLFREKLLYLK